VDESEPEIESAGFLDGLREWITIRLYITCFYMGRI